MYIIYIYAWDSLLQKLQSSSQLFKFISFYKIDINCHLQMHNMNIRQLMKRKYINTDDTDL